MWYCVSTFVRFESFLPPLAARQTRTQRFQVRIVDAVALDVNRSFTPCPIAYVIEITTLIFVLAVPKSSNAGLCRPGSAVGCHVGRLKLGVPRDPRAERRRSKENVCRTQTRRRLV